MKWKLSFCSYPPIPEAGDIKQDAKWYEMLYKNVIMKVQAWMETSALFFYFVFWIGRRAFRAEQFFYLCTTKIVSKTRKRQTYFYMQWVLGVTRKNTSNEENVLLPPPPPISQSLPPSPSVNKSTTKIQLILSFLFFFLTSTIISFHASMLSFFVPSKTLQTLWSNRYEFRGHVHSYLNLWIMMEDTSIKVYGV